MSQEVWSGINIQWPISEEILSGSKCVETRTYPVPEHLFRKSILFVETPGKRGMFRARIRGIVEFVECFQYKNKKEFELDYPRHRVDESSEWAWGLKGKWGWELKMIKTFEEPIALNKRPGIKYCSNIKLPIDIS